MRGQLQARIAVSWGMALAMRFNEALESATSLHKDLDTSDMAPAAREAMKCECDAMRAVAIALKDDSQAALTLAEACLQHTNDPWTANVASNVARFGHMMAGDLKSFYATPWIPYSQTEDRLNLFASVYRRCLLGIAEIRQLRTQTAERHYSEGMHLAEQYMGPNSIAAALPASLLARLRYEQGRLDESEALVIDRVPLVAGAGMLDCALSTVLSLVRVAEWRGHFGRARGMLEQAESHGSQRGLGRLIAFVRSERIRLALAEGRSAEAGACLERLERLASGNPDTSLCVWSEIRSYASLGRAWIAATNDRLEESIDLLTHLQETHKSDHNHLAVLRFATDLAIVLFRANERERSIVTFCAVASAASAARIDQFILETGSQIGSSSALAKKNRRRSRRISISPPKP